MASKRLSRTFQLEELFVNLTVLENVLVGCHTVSSSGILSCGFYLPFARKEERRLRDESMECLAGVGLEERAYDAISELPSASGSLLA